MLTKQVNYVIEIWEPDDHKLAAASFELPAPALAIAVGDFIDPLVWGNTRPPPHDLLEVVRIVHLIVEAGEVVTHKICVATRKVDRFGVFRSGDEV
jgi:hypothetical protein